MSRLHHLIIDALDREIIAFVAMTGRGISGSEACDMLETAESRFGTTPAEHLSDNGRHCIARDT